MKRVPHTLIASLLLLDLLGAAALADGPGATAQPDVRPDTQAPSAGGSASAGGGSAGPATFAPSEPTTVSSSNGATQSGSGSGTTTATGPGTSATVPTTASGSGTDAPAPDGSAPATSGPDVDADASGTNPSTTDSGARVDANALVTGSFAGSAAGVGSAHEDVDFLPSTTTQTAGGLLLGAALALAGALILRRAAHRRP